MEGCLGSLIGLLFFLFVVIISVLPWFLLGLAFFLVARLVLKLTKPLGRTKWAQSKRVSQGIVLGLFLLSLIMMAIGLWHPTAPIDIFYIGYLGLWLWFPLWAFNLRGLAGFFSVLFLYFILFILVIPVPVIEKDYPRRLPEIREEDDRLEDKDPPYISTFTEKRRGRRGRLCYFNKSTAIIGLDLAEATDKEKELSERIHPTFGAAVKMTDSFDCDLLPSIDLIDGFTKYFDDRLLAAIEEYIHIGSSIFPGGKQGFLKVLLRKVLDQRDSPGRDMAAGYLAAAIELGGDKPEVPETIKKIAKSYLNTFMNDPCHSRPMGFYTKSETLEKVFYRDRFLQKPFGTEFWTDLALKEDLPPGREGLSPVIRMAEALLDDPDFRDAYTRFRTLKERLTNPEVNLNLEDLFPHQDLFKDEAKLSQALLSSEASKRRVQARGNINPNTFGVAVWPFSTSKENDLFARLYRTYELPKTEIMNDLIVAIKEGRVDLKPQPDSGWYDHQLYSLETLLLPHLAHEKDKLLLHARYKKRLREAFEAMLTKRRETHVKELFQIRTLGIEFKPVPTTPELSLEPIATHYLRTGRAYRSLAEDLRGVFGDRGITDIQLEDFDKGLLVELDRMASLFYGLYLVVCDDLGMAPRLEPKEIEGLSGLQEVRVDDGALNQCLIASIPELSKTEQQARFYLWQEAKTWIEDLKREKFLDEDTRFIAPVLSNYWGTKVRNWAVLGVRLLKIKAYYARPPKVAESRTYSDEEQISEDPERFPSESFDSKDFDWRPKEYVIPVQVFAEVTMGPKPLTREEFRRICDRYKTKDKILKALMGVSGDQNGSPLPLILGTFILILMLIIFIIRRCFVLRQPKD